MKTQITVTFVATVLVALAAPTWADRDDYREHRERVRARRYYNEKVKQTRDQIKTTKEQMKDAPKVEEAREEYKQAHDEVQTAWQKVIASQRKLAETAKARDEARKAIYREALGLKDEASSSAKDKASKAGDEQSDDAPQSDAMTEYREAIRRLMDLQRSGADAEEIAAAENALAAAQSRVERDKARSERMEAREAARTQSKSKKKAEPAKVVESAPAEKMTVAQLRTRYGANLEKHPEIARHDEAVRAAQAEVEIAREAYHKFSKERRAAAEKAYNVAQKQAALQDRMQRLEQELEHNQHRREQYNNSRTRYYRKINNNKKDGKGHYYR